MVSMSDIAKAAGISRTTVSLVLNDRHVDGINIPDETRKRIRELAQKMGYRPNKLAASVVTGKSKIIGCIGLDVAESSAIGLGELISAVVRSATIKDYSVKLLSSLSSLESLVNSCISYRVCAVLLRTRDREFFEKLAAALKKHGIPVVLIDTAYDDPGVPSVVNDDYDGMRQAVEYVVAAGLRQLTFLAFEDYQPFTVRRMRGFLNTVRQFNDVSYTFCNTDNAEPVHAFERSQKIIGQLLAGPNRPEALVCNCDEIAMIALRSAMMQNLRVPGDLSVIGFGNLPTDLLTSPELTSLAPDYDRLAVNAIDIIDSGDFSPRETVIAMAVKIRKSVQFQ